MIEQDREAMTGTVRWVDNLGIALSTLCAVHCVLTPVILAVLPFASLDGAESIFRRSILAVGVLGVSLGTAIHKNWRALTPLAGAISVAVGMEVLQPLGLQELMMSLAVSALLITAHVLNSGACSKICSHCPAHD